MTWGKQNREAEAHEQMSYATDHGINFFDSAGNSSLRTITSAVQDCAFLREPRRKVTLYSTEMYPAPADAWTQGRTDQYIGSWLKDRKREDIVLATKVSGYSDRMCWVRDTGAVTRVNKAQVQESVDKSLARLGVDYVDLLQIHWPDRYVPLFGCAGYEPQNKRDAVPFDEQLEALQNVVEQGKVRYIGVSNETSYGVMEFIKGAELAGLPRIQTIQNCFSLLVRSGFETDLAEVCHQLDVSLLAYSPLAGGTLTGKYLRGNVSDKARLKLFPGFMARYNKSLAREAIMEYLQVAEEHGLTATALALAWCRQRWCVTSTIIGATTMEQLKENLDAFDVELTEACLRDINEVFRRFHDPTSSMAYGESASTMLYAASDTDDECYNYNHGSRAQQPRKRWSAAPVPWDREDPYKRNDTAMF